MEQKTTYRNLLRSDRQNGGTTLEGSSKGRTALEEDGKQQLETKGIRERWRQGSPAGRQQRCQWKLVAGVQGRQMDDLDGHCQRRPVAGEQGHR